MGVAPSSIGIQESDVAMELPQPQHAQGTKDDTVANDPVPAAARGSATHRPQQQQQQRRLLDNRDYLNQQEKELMHRYNIQLSALWEQQQQREQLAMNKSLSATACTSTALSREESPVIVQRSIFVNKFYNKEQSPSLTKEEIEDGLQLVLKSCESGQSSSSSLLQPPLDWADFGHEVSNAQHDQWRVCARGSAGTVNFVLCQLQKWIKITKIPHHNYHLTNRLGHVIRMELDPSLPVGAYLQNLKILGQNGGGVRITRIADVNSAFARHVEAADGMRHYCIVASVNEQPCLSKQSFVQMKHDTPRSQRLRLVVKCLQECHARLLWTYVAGEDDRVDATKRCQPEAIAETSTTSGLQKQETSHGNINTSSSATKAVKDHSSRDALSAGLASSSQGSSRVMATLDNTQSKVDSDADSDCRASDKSNIQSKIDSDADTDCCASDMSDSVRRPATIARQQEDIVAANCSNVAGIETETWPPSSTSVSPATSAPVDCNTAQHGCSDRSMNIFESLGLDPGSSVELDPEQSKSVDTRPNQNDRGATPGSVCAKKVGQSKGASLDTPGATKDSSRPAPTERLNEGSGRKTNVDKARVESDAAQATNLRADWYPSEQRNTEQAMDIDASQVLDQGSSIEGTPTKSNGQSIIANVAETDGAKTAVEPGSTGKGSRQTMGWNVFKRKLGPLLEIEFKRAGIHKAFAASRAWHQHKLRYTDSCGDNCECAYDLPFLTETVITDQFEKDPEWANPMDLEVEPECYPIGLTGNFARAFMPKLKEQYPSESSTQHLDRLLHVWSIHRRSKKFGPRCHDTCKCVHGWAGLFRLGALEREESALSATTAPIPKKRKTAWTLIEPSAAVGKKRQVTESSTVESSEPLRSQESVESATTVAIPKKRKAPANLAETSTATGKKKQLTESLVVAPNVPLGHQESKELANSTSVPKKRRPPSNELSTDASQKDQTTETTFIESTEMAASRRLDTVSRGYETTVEPNPSRHEKREKEVLPVSMNSTSERTSYVLQFDCKIPLGFYCVTDKQESPSFCKVISVCPHGSNPTDPRIQHQTKILSYELEDGAMKSVQSHFDLKAGYDEARESGATLNVTFINTDVTTDSVQRKSRWFARDWTSGGQWGGKSETGWDGGAWACHRQPTAKYTMRENICDLPVATSVSVATDSEQTTYKRGRLTFATLHTCRTYDKESCPQEFLSDGKEGKDRSTQLKPVVPKEKALRKTQLKAVEKPDVSMISLNRLSIKELLGYLKNGYLEDDDAIKKLQYILKHEIEDEILASRNDPNMRQRARELGLIRRVLKIAITADFNAKESQSVDSWERLQVHVTAIDRLERPAALQCSELCASVKFVTANGPENILGRLPWKAYMPRISFEETPPYGAYYNPTFMAEDGKFEFRLETRERRGHKRTYQGTFQVKLADLTPLGTSDKDSWDLTFDSSQCGVDFSSPSACICLRVNRVSSENVLDYRRKKHKDAKCRLDATIEWATRLNDDLENWNTDYSDDIQPLGADIRLAGGLSLLHAAIFLKDTSQLARLLDLKQEPIDQICLNSALSIADDADRLDDDITMDEMSRMLSDRIQTQTSTSEPNLARLILSTSREDSPANAETHPATAAAGGPDRPNKRPSTELTNDDSTRPTLLEHSWTPHPHEDRVGLGNILADRPSEICAIIPCLDQREWRNTDPTKECPSFKTRHWCRNLKCPLVHVYRMTCTDIDHAVTVKSMKNESLSWKMGRIHARHKFVRTKHVDIDISGVEGDASGTAPATTISLWTAAFDAPDEVFYAVGGKNAILSQDGVSWYRDQADSIEALAKTVVVGQRARLTEYVPRAYQMTTTTGPLSTRVTDVPHDMEAAAPARPDKRPKTGVLDDPGQSELCAMIPAADSHREWLGSYSKPECSGFQRFHTCRYIDCSALHVHRMTSSDVDHAVRVLHILDKDLACKMAKIHPEHSFIRTKHVHVNGRQLWTAAFSARDEIFYAVGGDNVLLSQDRASWYKTKSEAITALKRTIVVSQRARLKGYVPMAYKAVNGK